jgi:hypothetical protein
MRSVPIKSAMYPSDHRPFFRLPRAEPTEESLHNSIQHRVGCSWMPRIDPLFPRGVGVFSINLQGTKPGPVRERPSAMFGEQEKKIAGVVVSLP